MQDAIAIYKAKEQRELMGSVQARNSFSRK